MPIYAYRCGVCHHLMEVFHRSKIVPPEQCSHCGAPEPKRVLSTVSAITKGDPGCATPTGQCGMETGHCTPSG